MPARIAAALAGALLSLTVGACGDSSPPATDGPNNDAGLDAQRAEAGTDAPPVADAARPSSWAVEKAFANLPNFSGSVQIERAHDGSGRFFVLEAQGRIQMFVPSAGVSSAKRFLDIAGRVTVGGEMGLLGLAFHPDHKNNGLFYVNYTSSKSGPRRTVIAEYKLVPGDPDSGDPASERILLEINQPHANHNGGKIAFGPDNLLYIGMGDGGSSGDPDNNGQTTSTLLGALLRIDVDGRDGAKPYAVPPDNPFVGGGGAPEIYAWGLRNPWGFSWDAPTGRLWLADVGQNAWEEINVVEKGKNYGWHVMEGKQCYKPGCSEIGEKPVFDYAHDLHPQGRASITGGYVYRGAREPWLRGKYLYADYENGHIWALSWSGSGRGSAELLLKSQIQITSFVDDAAGEVYFVDAGGGVWQLASQ